MNILSANNTIIGIRLDQRRPAIPAALPDFGSDAELEVERQAHAVTCGLLEQARQDLADLRYELAQAHQLAHSLTQQHSVDRAELARMRQLLADADAVIRQTTADHLAILDRMADDGEYVVEVYS